MSLSHRWNRRRPSIPLILALSIFAAAMISSPARAVERGFVSLFDGRTLDGWHTVSGATYLAHDGILTCPIGGRNLFSEKEYSDFVFRFDFRLTPGANNGIGIRAPFDGDAAYTGMEIQVLDDSAPEYARLEPWQYHGSVYGVTAARRGALRAPGQWNSEEISAVGRRVRVVLNGRVIVNTNLDDVREKRLLEQHPGIQRVGGHIGFLGHTNVVDFRNIRIKDLSRTRKLNEPPAGYRALFNGHNLDGWKGLVMDPPRRARLSAEELQRLQVPADRAAFQHWKVVDGIITYDGRNDNLCTRKDFADFAMTVDWKILAGGDSGIYLRGSPQVQIWDRDEGSGGLYNNEKHTSHPLKKADHPTGEWNHFEIVMVGSTVTVYLNGELVTDRVPLENYWERTKPIYPAGAIELQHHNSPLWFKNIFIRELPAGH